MANNFYPAGSSTANESPDLVVGPTFLTSPTLTTTPLNGRGIQYELGEDCNIRVVAVTQGDVAPTSTQVLAGQNSASAAAISSTTLTAYVATGGLDSIEITGLVQGTTYDFYIAAVNAATGETLAPVMTGAVADVTAPVITVQPALVSKTSSTITFNFTAGEGGTYRAMAAAAGAAVPTAANIMSGSWPGGSVVDSTNITAYSANVVTEITMSGMALLTTYDMYVAVEDSSGNQTLSTLFTESTSDATPQFTGTIPNQTANKDVAFNVDLSTFWTGETGFTFTGGPFPGGLSLNTTTGVISGTPTTVEVSNSITVSASNAAGSTAGNAFDITVTSVPPTFTAGPAVNTITTTSANGTFTSSKDGNYRIVLIPSADSAPTVDEVLAGTGSGAIAAVFDSGLLAMTAAVGESVAMNTGLTANTSYKFYVALTDADANKVLSSATNFTTSALPDTTAPAFTQTPVASLQSINSGRITFTTDEGGHYRIVLVAAGAASPSATEVLAGQASGGGSPLFSSGLNVLSTSVQVNYDFTGITSNTAFDSYTAIEDALNNSAVSAAVPLTTTAVTDTTAPDFTVAVNVSSTTSSAINASFTPDEAGTYRAVVVPTASPAPTSTEILAGTGSGGAVPSTSISLTGMDAGTSYPLNLAGLTASTSYNIYVALADASGNERSSGAVPATTQSLGASPPVFSGTIADQVSPNGSVISLNVGSLWSNSPTSYVLTSGTLPTGLTLNTTTGVISGTTTTVQSLTGLIITATNAGGSAVSNSFDWSVTSPTGGAKFTGLLKNWSTSAAYADGIGIKISVSETFGGSAINPTVGVFNTDATGNYSVTISEATAGVRYYVLKESADGTITSLQQQVAEVI